MMTIAKRPLRGGTLRPARKDYTTVDFNDLNDLIDEINAGPGSFSVIATGSTAGRTLADRFAETFDIKDYGATGDGVTDDTTAIRAAITAMRAKLATWATLSGYDREVVLLFPPGRYLVSGSLNLQKLFTQSFVILGEGATIKATCTGKTVIDLLGSRFYTIRGLTIIGDATNIPAIGIQSGRLDVPPNTYCASDSALFDNVRMGGKFSRSCFYGLQCEQDTWIECQFYNLYTSGDAAAWIFDGYNSSTLGAITDFDAPLQAANTAISCSMHTWIGGTGYGRTPFVFIECVDIDTINLFVASSTTAEGCRVVTSSGGVYHFKWRVVTEGGAPSDTLVIDRLTSGSVVAYDVTVIDTTAQSTNSLIKAGANVTVITFFNGVVETGIKFQGTASPFSGASAGLAFIYNGTINGLPVSWKATGDADLDMGSSGTAAAASVWHFPMGAALTAPRTWTLPDLTKYPLGIRRIVSDPVGAVTPVNYLKVIPAAGHTINGKTAWHKHNAGGNVEFFALRGSLRWSAPPETGSLRLGTQFDKTADTTLANVTGLIFTVVAGKTYCFRARLFMAVDATGGSKVAIAGTATATSLRHMVKGLNSASPPAFVYGGQQTSLGGGSGGAAGTAHYTEIDGVIVVSAGGTLAVQFAQVASNLTSSVLIGSTFDIEEIVT